MNDIDTELDRLGDALLAAAREDLLARGRPAVAARRPRRRRMRLATAACVLAVAVPATAFATGVFSPDQEVAHGLSSLEWQMAGTEPTCTALKPGVEYACTLAEPPQEETLPSDESEIAGTVHGRPGEWKGYVIGTVDKTDHVNGGCRAEDPDGLRWRCYLGQASVDQKILMPSALGQYLPGSFR